MLKYVPEDLCYEQKKTACNSFDMKICNYQRRINVDCKLIELKMVISMFDCEERKNKSGKVVCCDDFPFLKFMLDFLIEKLAYEGN